MESDDDWNFDSVANDFLENQNFFERDRVFLKNVPAELTKEGLHNMCEKYGTIVDIVRPAEKNYAFVQFESTA